jgi:hypothetical protein
MPSPTFHTKRYRPAIVACFVSYTVQLWPTESERGASRFPEASRRDLIQGRFLARLGDRLPAHPSGEPARMLEMDWASLL